MTEILALVPVPALLLFLAPVLPSDLRQPTVPRRSPPSPASFRQSLREYYFSPTPEPPDRPISELYRPGEILDSPAPSARERLQSAVAAVEEPQARPDSAAFETSPRSLLSAPARWQQRHPQGIARNPAATQ